MKSCEFLINYTRETDSCNGGLSRHHINQVMKINTARNCVHWYHVSLRRCAEKYIEFHPKMLNLIIRKELESSKLGDVWQLEFGLQKYQWHERRKEETKEIRQPNAMCHHSLDPKAGEEKTNTSKNSSIEILGEIWVWAICCVISLHQCQISWL